MAIQSMMPSNHLILCHPLLLLPSILPSIRVFSNESVLHIRWPMYWRFNFSISPSSEYSGLISFRVDCLDLLVVQGTLKSLLQRHSSEVWLRRKKEKTGVKDNLQNMIYDCWITGQRVERKILTASVSDFRMFLFQVGISKRPTDWAHICMYIFLLYIWYKAC